MLAGYDELRGDSREQWILTRVIVATRNQLWSDLVDQEESGRVPPGASSNSLGPGGSDGRPSGRASPPHSARPVGLAVPSRSSSSTEPRTIRPDDEKDDGSGLSLEEAVRQVLVEGRGDADLLGLLNLFF